MNQLEQEQEKKNEQTAKNITKALAIVGLVVVLAGAAWLSVQAFKSVPTLVSRMNTEGAAVTLSSLFSREEEVEISASLDKTVISSGETLDLSVGGLPENGRFSISFECKEEATFVVKDASGTSTDAVCNTPIVVSNTTDPINIAASSKNARYLDVYLTVALLDADGKASTEIKDTALFTIVSENGTSTATTTKPNVVGRSATTTVSKPVVTKPTTTTTPVPTRPVVTGPADLAVTITATGVTLGNNAFFPTTEIPTDARGAVKFVVENKGGQVSGPWGFTANLPIEGDSDYKYTAPLQRSLAAGEKIEFTLGFDEVLEEKTGVIKITLLPASNTDKTTNNTVQTSVRIKEK